MSTFNTEEIIYLEGAQHFLSCITFRKDKICFSKKVSINKLHLRDLISSELHLNFQKAGDGKVSQ